MEQSTLQVTFEGPNREAVEELMRRFLEGGGSPVVSTPAGEDPKDPKPTDATADDMDRPWTQEEIAELKRTINVTGRAMMELTSARPGEWVSFEEVCEAAGQTAKAANPYLSGLTRHVRKYYGHSKWPVDYQAGPSLGLPYGIHYRISNEKAEWWNKASAS